MSTYRGGEFSRLGRLPALLADWGQRCIDCGDVVCGKSAVQLATGI